MTQVADAVSALERLTLAELRERWVGHTGSPAPKVGTNMLRLALAWEIQASARGGLPRSASQVLDQLARGSTRTEAKRREPDCGWCASGTAGCMW